MSPSRHPDRGAHEMSVEGQPTPMSLPSTDSYTEGSGSSEVPMPPFGGLRTRELGSSNWKKADQGDPATRALPSTDSYLPAEEASPPILGIVLLGGITFWLGFIVAGLVS